MRVLYVFFADAILLLHFAIVVFITAGLPFIWIGAARGWRWVRNRVFRMTHLAAIVFVALESLAGAWCPLTVWEHALRGTASEKSFVAHWVHRVMFYQFPEWVFTIAYVAFALAVAATWRLVPPQRKPSSQQ